MIIIYIYVERVQLGIMSLMMIDQWIQGCAIIPNFQTRTTVITHDSFGTKLALKIFLTLFLHASTNALHDFSQLRLGQKCRRPGQGQGHRVDWVTSPPKHHVVADERKVSHQTWSSTVCSCLFYTKSLRNGLDIERQSIQLIGTGFWVSWVLFSHRCNLHFTACIAQPFLACEVLVMMCMSPIVSTYRYRHTHTNYIVKYYIMY